MYEQTNEVVNAENGRAVEIQVKLVIDGVEGTVNITDLMLQGGSISTKWTGHPSEIKWTVDG